MKVSLFIPCFIDQVYPHVGISIVKVLERLGCEVDYPEGQTCCGQPAFNSGYWDEARKVADHALDVFNDSDVVVSASGSCGAMMKVFYPELFQNTTRHFDALKLAPKIWEFSDFLVNKLGVTDVGARFDGTVTFHDGCHGLRELGVESQPRELLKHVKGLTLVEMKEAKTCCGFGGTFSVKFPSISTAMGEVKCASLLETGAETVVSNDSSCLMQIGGMLQRQGKPVRCLHLAEVLADMITFAKDFKSAAERVTSQTGFRAFLRKSLSGYEGMRDHTKGRYQNWNDARQAASEIKWDAVNHLDKHLQEFIAKLEARGTKVYVAADADHARDYILQVVKDNGVKSIIKSKSMTTEEIHLNDALEKLGHKVYESDLGEYIVQLLHEPPYHFVAPAMHLTRDQISDLFHKELGSPRTSDPEELTMIARGVMRDKYLESDMGISGGNFAIAETGMISITENEGNARLTCAIPKIHVAVMGIEKVLPRLEDLALFLPMLATMGTGQGLTSYNTLYGGPRQPGEVDGPEQFHVVLLDNRRTELLADPEQRDALHCIRCGACLNVCPIFKNVGGHSYGTTYQGPIGAVITPHLRGLQNWKHLTSASSLCGACTETCPVGIDIHHHLLHSRRNAMQEKPLWWEKILYQGFVFLMRHPGLYCIAGKLGGVFFPLHKLVNNTALDPLRSWTGSRELPTPAAESFTDYWNNHKLERRNGLS